MAFDLSNYEDVDTRIHKFWEANENGRIRTEIVYFGNGENGQLKQVVIQADIWKNKNDEFPDATDFAEEVQGATPVNRTSFIENCSTSAIGRALATMGYAKKGARPSTAEMTKVERVADNTEQFTDNYQGYGGQRQAGGGFSKTMMTKKQQDLIMKLVAGQIHIIDEYKTEHKIDGGFTTQQASKFIEYLKANPEVDPWAQEAARGGSDE